MDNFHWIYGSVCMFIRLKCETIMFSLKCFVVLCCAVFGSNMLFGSYCVGWFLQRNEYERAQAKLITDKTHSATYIRKIVHVILRVYHLNFAVLQCTYVSIIVCVVVVQFMRYYFVLFFGSAQFLIFISFRFFVELNLYAIIYNNMHISRTYFPFSTFYHRYCIWPKTK